MQEWSKRCRQSRVFTRSPARFARKWTSAGNSNLDIVAAARGNPVGGLGAARTDPRGNPVDRVHRRLDVWMSPQERIAWSHSGHPSVMDDGRGNGATVTRVTPRRRAA